MSKKLLYVTLILSSILFVFSFMEAVNIDLPSVISTITSIVSIIGGASFILAIFAFLSEKDKKVIALIGSIVTVIVSGALIYFSISPMSLFSKTGLTLIKIGGYGVSALAILISVALYLLFEKESSLFNIFKLFAAISVSAYVIYIVVMFSKSTITFSSETTMIGSIFTVVTSFALGGAVITYLIPSDSNVDKTNENYYADVKNLTYNQNKTAENYNNQNTVAPQVAEPVNQPVEQVVSPVSTPVMPVQSVAPAPAVSPEPVQQFIQPAPVEPEVSAPQGEPLVGLSTLQSVQASPVVEQAPVAPVQQPVVQPTPQVQVQPAPVQPVAQPVQETPQAESLNVEIPTVVPTIQQNNQ